MEIKVKNSEGGLKGRFKIDAKNEALIYKILFELNETPVVLYQCCNDDPAEPEGCFSGLLSHAQDKLNHGSPVVLKCFGRRVLKGDNEVSFGTVFKTDMILVYAPGEKIDREFFKKCQETNEKSRFITE